MSGKGKTTKYDEFNPVLMLMKISTLRRSGEAQKINEYDSRDDD